MRELQAIQNDINMMDQAIQNAGMGVDVSSWQGEKDKYEREFVDATAYWEGQQNLQDRVEQAKETGYYFDTLTTSGGSSMEELSYSPENHELQAIAVQKGFLAQEDAFNSKYDSLMNDFKKQEDELNTVRNDLEEKIEDNFRLHTAMNQLSLEKKDSDSKRDNAIRQAEELANELNIQADELKKLKDQLAGEAVPIAPLSEEEKESKLMAEVMGKQIKIINVRPKLDTFDNKLFIATNVITGVEFEDYYIYLCKKDEDKPKRYKEISQELADILREEYATKKAELEAQNTVIPVMDPQDEPIGLGEIAEPGPIEDNESQAINDGDIQNDQGNQSLHAAVEQTESEIESLEQYYAMPATMGDIARIKEQIQWLNGRMDDTAVRLDVIEGHKAVA